MLSPVCWSTSECFGLLIFFVCYICFYIVGIHFFLLRQVLILLDFPILTLYIECCLVDIFMQNEIYILSVSSYFHVYITITECNYCLWCWVSDPGLYAWLVSPLPLSCDSSLHVFKLTGFCKNISSNVFPIVVSTILSSYPISFWIMLQQSNSKWRKILFMEISFLASLMIKTTATAMEEK